MRALFQISKAYCRGGSLKYSYISKEDCETKRCDVEVNTAVASYHLDKNFKHIQRKCPNASLEEVILLSYVGHNNGPAVLSHVLAREDVRKKIKQKQFVLFTMSVVVLSEGLMLIGGAKMEVWSKNC